FGGPHHQSRRRGTVLHPGIPGAGGIGTCYDAIALDAVDAIRHSGGSTASSYSRLNRAINSAAGTIFPTLPTPWPLPQISFQAFGLARSPEPPLPNVTFDEPDCGRLSGSMPAATIDGFR